MDIGATSGFRAPAGMPGGGGSSSAGTPDPASVMSGSTFDLFNSLNSTSASLTAGAKQAQQLAKAEQAQKTAEEAQSAQAPQATGASTGATPAGVASAGAATSASQSSTQSQQAATPPEQPKKEKKGFFSKLGAAIKGATVGTVKNVAKAVKDTVTNPKKLLTAAAMGAACFIPGVNAVAIPALAAWGVSNAAKGIAKGGMATVEGWKNDDTKAIENGMADVGTGAASGALSVAGMRGVVRASGATPKGTGFKQSSGMMWNGAKELYKGAKPSNLKAVAGAEGSALQGAKILAQQAKTGTVNNFRTQFLNPFKSGAATQSKPPIGSDVQATQASQLRSNIQPGSIQPTPALSGLSGRVPIRTPRQVANGLEVVDAGRLGGVLPGAAGAGLQPKAVDDYIKAQESQMIDPVMLQGMDPAMTQQLGQMIPQQSTG